MRASRPRERLVLTAIIELYIATGEPVASQAVARYFSNQEGLSSATLRNVMATLGEAGLLEQPHTSAGRVPTAAAFRYYVEQITRPESGRIDATDCRSGRPAVALERRAPRPDRRELFRRGQQQRLSGAHLARAGAAFQRPGRGSGQLHRRPGAGAHSLFAAFHGPCAGRAGYAGRSRAGSRAGAGSRADPRRAGNRRALPERELSRLAHRAHPRRGGPPRRTGARGLPPDAGLGRGALPQGRAGWR